MLLFFFYLLSFYIKKKISFKKKTYSLSNFNLCIFLLFFLHCILKSTLTLTTKIYKFLIIFIEFYPFIFIKWTTSYLNSEIFHHLSEWILFNNLIANEIINFFFFTSISTSTLHHLQIFSYFLSMISLIKCFK